MIFGLPGWTYPKILIFRAKIDTCSVFQLAFFIGKTKWPDISDWTLHGDHGWSRGGLSLEFIDPILSVEGVFKLINDSHS